MKTSFHVSVLVLLTGCLTVSLLTTDATTNSTETNATRSDLIESNTTVKRSFDFPTIFYPGPDNRFITLAPLPKLPHDFLSSSNDHQTDPNIKNEFQHQLIDDFKPARRPRPQVNVHVDQINNAEHLSSFPAQAFRPPSHVDIPRILPEDRPKKITLTTTTLAPDLFSPQQQHQLKFNQVKQQKVSKQISRFHPHPTTFRPVHHLIQQFPAVDNKLNISSTMVHEDAWTSGLKPTAHDSALPQLTHRPPPSDFKHRPRLNDIDAFIPPQSFVCRRKMTGYFADIETGCQSFHICHNSRRFSFRCPNGTRFSQSLLVCDWQHRVKCS